MSKIVKMLTTAFVSFVLLGGAIVFLSPGQTVDAQEGEVTPTAEPCGNPTLQSVNGNVNVRNGPALEFDIIGTTSETDVGLIVGRAGFVQWWLIQLDNGVTGWVSNDAVTVQGNIGQVPIVEPPALADGTAPTSDSAWIPAVNSFCETSNDAEATPTPDNVSEWSLPTNLSGSGATSDPRMVVDSNGLFHIVWKDDVDGFVYVQGNSLVWNEPEIVELPFGTRVYYPDLNDTEPTPYFVPTLVADQSGNIHAFWIDNENGLYYSSVPAASFGTFSAWRTRQILAQSALQFDVSLDSSGTFHLTYVRLQNTDEAPSGVYYRQSVNNGEAFSSAVSLYESRYFHAITADQVNIDLLTTNNDDATQVFVVWDNRLLGQVLAARSMDGGLSWDPSFQVDSRELEDTAEAVNPGHISIGARENDIVLLWEAGHDGEICAHYYISSSDMGDNWQPREKLLKPRGCHRTNQFFETEDGYLVLLALVDDVVGTKGYLLAWDGQNWSDPQEQSILTTFKNPVTYLDITYNCHQSTYIRPETLFVVGCDGGAGRDIWLTRRIISGIEDWFAPPSVWQEPELVSAQPGKITSLNLLADADGLLHVFWASPGKAELYYANHNNLFWSQPVEVLRALVGNSGQPVATLDNSGHMLVAWNGTESGQIYFSWAETGRANTPADWSPTQVVSEPGLAAQSPQIMVDPSGSIYLIYVVPLNEERGIYLVRSDDGGSTWTPSIQVFDGVAAGWAIVDKPRLALTGDGKLHILLNHYQKVGEGDPLAIFYSRSEDRGMSWSAPNLMAEQPVISGEIFGSGLETLQRLWFFEGNSGLDIWHDLSIDSGRSWQSSSSATGFGQPDGPMAATADPAGRLNVLGVNNNVLQHWMWENNRWTIETEASLETDTVGNVSNIGATIATNGDLVVVFAVDGLDTTLYYTSRSLELPEILPPPTPEPIQTPVITPTVTATTVPPPTATLPPTPVPNNLSLPNADSGENDSAWEIAFSFLPAVLLVGVAFFFGLRAIRGSQR